MPVRPDVERIKREVRAEERAQQTLETNLAVIGREYPEIFNDPVLTQVAALQLHNLRGHPAAGQMAELISIGTRAVRCGRGLVPRISNHRGVTRGGRRVIIG